MTQWQWSVIRALLKVTLGLLRANPHLAVSYKEEEKLLEEAIERDMNDFS